MKRKLIIICCCMCLLVGCGKEDNTGKELVSSDTVPAITTSQVAEVSEEEPKEEEIKEVEEIKEEVGTVSDNIIMIDNEYFTATIDTDIFEYRIMDEGLYGLVVVPKVSLENGDDVPSNMSIYVFSSSQKDLELYNKDKSLFTFTAGIAFFSDIEMDNTKIGCDETEFMYMDNYTAYFFKSLHMDDKYMINTVRTDNFVYDSDGTQALNEFEKSIVIK